MYTLNVSHLKQFYASALGEAASAALKRCISSIWPGSDTDIVLAIGFPNALWNPTQIPKNLLVGMPAEHGALCWPAEKNKVAAIYDGNLPIADNVINRIILIHALEHSSNVSALMQEVWRVLAPQGRMLAIVPNRMGLWARSSKSPFGYGRPFSLSQVKSAVEESQLTLLKSRSTLFLPPTHNRILLKCAHSLEFTGRLLLPMCGGLHVVEAEKQLYAPIMQPLRVMPKPTAQAVAITATPRNCRNQ